MCQNLSTPVGPGAEGLAVLHMHGMPEELSLLVPSQICDGASWKDISGLHCARRKLGVNCSDFGVRFGVPEDHTHLECPAHVGEGVPVNGVALPGGLILARPRLGRCISASRHRSPRPVCPLQRGVIRLARLLPVQLHAAKGWSASALSQKLRSIEGRWRKPAQGAAFAPCGTGRPGPSVLYREE